MTILEICGRAIDPEAFVAFDSSGRGAERQERALLTVQLVLLALRDNVTEEMRNAGVRAVEASNPQSMERTFRAMLDKALEQK